MFLLKSVMAIGVIIGLVWLFRRLFLRSVDDISPLGLTRDSKRGTDLRMAFISAFERSQTWQIFRSGRTTDELHAHLELSLQESLEYLPEDLEVVPESAVYFIPDLPYKGLYDGQVSVRLRRRESAT